MANYTDSQIREIAQINVNEHMGLLTGCGISRDMAGKMIAAPQADLDRLVPALSAKTEPKAVAMLRAVRVELIIRQEA